MHLIIKYDKIDLGDKTLDANDANETTIEKDLKSDFEVVGEVDNLDYTISCTSWPDFEIDWWDLKVENGGSDKERDFKYKWETIWTIKLNWTGEIKIKLKSRNDIRKFGADFPLSLSFDKKKSFELVICPKESLKI